MTKTQKAKSKKLVALFVSLMMLLSMVPFTVLANDGSENSNLLVAKELLGTMIVVPFGTDANDKDAMAAAATEVVQAILDDLGTEVIGTVTYDIDEPGEEAEGTDERYMLSLSISVDGGIATLTYEVTVSVAAESDDDSGNNNSSSNGSGGGATPKPEEKPVVKPEEPPVTPVRPVAPVFNDVSANAWYAENVKYVYENGLMTGTSNGNFSPNTNMTRGMIVTVLHRLAGTPAAGAASFTDVPSNAWYGTAAAWAQNDGIVQGFDGKFNPDGDITRQDLAVILVRYAQSIGFTLPTDRNLPNFADSANISDYAEAAINALY